MAKELLLPNHSPDPTEKISAVLKRFLMGEAGELDDLSAVEAFKRSRDGACFAVLFDRYAKRLYGLAHAICRDHARAEDCVQETFRRAMEEIDRFDERRWKSNFWAWLVTIAEHVNFDEIRRTRTREAYAKECAPGEPLARTLSPEQQAMISELRKAILKLAPEIRVCYLLHIDGYSYQEIARLTGFRNQQVRTCIQTAARHIRRGL